jgi:hypothetical protein
MLLAMPLKLVLLLTYTTQWYNGVGPSAWSKQGQNCNHSLSTLQGLRKRSKILRYGYAGDTESEPHVIQGDRAYRD